MVAADAGNAAITQQAHHGIWFAAIADQVAEASDLMNVKPIDPEERRLEGTNVAVDVSDESQPHGIETVPGLVVRWIPIESTSSASLRQAI